MKTRTTTPRVLHIVPALFGAQEGGVVGGAERYALELARHMTAATPTRLVTFGEHDREEKIDDLSIRVIGSPWRVRGQENNPIAARLLPELRQAEVVHCHQQHILVSSLSALFCRLSGRRIYVSDLGGGGWDFSGYFSTDRWYHRHLHISEYSRRVFGHESRPWAHVILGGVDTKKFSPDSDVARLDKAVFAGRLLPHKGVDVLMPATPPGLKLELIGQAYDRRYLEDLRRLARDSDVSFRHDCNDPELIRAYREAMCVVLPSVYRTMYGRESKTPELLGQTLIEAMACETPVICTDVASMPEIVQDGVTGFITPPNDDATLRERLFWLRDHRAETREMGRAARRRALEKFTWPAVVERCLEIYRQ
jgi:glycosyltransferase involved in cell wall biosynthesis